MEKLNLNLLRFFTENYKPGIIGIVGTNGTIGMGIREAQKGTGVIQEWSEWRSGKLDR